MAFLSVKLIVLDHSCVQPMAKLPSQLLSCMFFLLRCFSYLSHNSIKTHVTVFTYFWTLWPNWLNFLVVKKNLVYDRTETKPRHACIV